MKKRAVRCMAVFFSAMLILTLCSRTIYRSTLVKVRAAKPTGGTLKYEYTTDSFKLSADEYQYEYIPFYLSQALTVERVYIQLGDRIEPGAPLLSFYPVDGEDLLGRAELALRQAEYDMKSWKNEMAAKQSRMESEMEAAESQAEREAIVGEMELLKMGFLNGRSEEEVKDSYQAAQETVDYLKSLKENGWTMTAKSAGVVCAVRMEEGNKYLGMDPICLLADEETDVYLHIGPFDLPDAASETWNWKIMLQNGQEAFKFADCSVRNGMIAVMLGELPDISLVRQIKIFLESPYERILVPCSAISGDSLFLLEADVGDWGEEILVAREKRILLGDSDGENCAVLDGLHTGDRMIVYASGALMDGQIVVKDSYE